MYEASGELIVILMTICWLLKELEVKEKYQIEITNRFAALEILNVDDDVNRFWENIKENI